MKFILITKQGLTDQKVNINTKAFYDSQFGEILETVDTELLSEVIKIPPKQINININGHYLTQVLLKAITPAYLRGTQIVVNGIAIPTCHSNPQYFFKWQDKVPTSLPEHLKEAYYNFKLYGKLYNELVEWNQSRINRAIECSKFKWELAEKFYKDLFKALKPKNITVLSPNEKTFYEANAELDFEQIVKQQPALTPQEQAYLDIAELKHYNRAFGLQDTTVRTGYRHRTTPHGTTEEPVVISDYDLDQTFVAIGFSKTSGRQLDGFKTDNGFEIKQWNSTLSNIVNLHSRERENIETLKWILSQPKSVQSELLMPGWHFCPVCGELYNELDGCYDSNGNCHIEPVEFVSYNDETHDNEDEEELGF